VDAAEARALVGRWFDEVWGQGRLELIDELVAEPYVRHSQQGTVVRTRQEVKEDFVQYLRVIRHAVTTVDDQTVDDDRVWSRLTSKGVSAETGDPVTITWLQINRIADGRLAETWVLTARDVDWTS
jgi:hypothetical protein